MLVEGGAVCRPPPSTETCPMLCNSVCLLVVVSLKTSMGVYSAAHSFFLKLVSQSNSSFPSDQSQEGVHSHGV
ncbi:hypothetical protein EYF80_040433 [Liparis tanakae]|uniref:Uncharacterized protein n=1 Tax=Liparis tanakae TaxID=230148 RepID=A0A4Z2GA10_9TELE|nr:hypothetical protein EYF80_040433 [Liparis tanakae]